MARERGDKGQRRIVALSPIVGLALLANGSCSDTSSSEGSTRTEEAREATFTKPVPCTMQVDGSAVVSSFSVTTSLTGSPFDLVPALTASYDSRRDTTSGLKVDNVQMKFLGAPFFTGRIEANMNNAQPVTKIVMDLAPPYIGVRHVEVAVSGSTAVATLDGRKTKPFAITAPVSSIRMQDGLPFPRIVLPPLWPERITRLGTLAQAEAATCSSIGAAPASASPSGLLALPADAIPGHESGTTFEHASGDCLLLQGGCVTATATCVYGATAAAAGCAAIPVIGWFAAPVCAGVSLYGCYEAEKACLSAAVTSDKCCPKRCGGSSDSPRCCFRDESCTDSRILCCSPGNPPCGDSLCCISGDQCVRTETCVGALCTSTAQCCPAQRACGSVCCADGETCPDPATGQCCPAGHECGTTCCDFLCGDPSKNLCCGLGGEVCGNTCCGFFEDCVNGACVATPPDAQNCGANSISCTTNADCPADCGSSSCKCQILQGAAAGCCVKSPT